MNRRVETQGSRAVERIAGHYASELDAQFRTLNHFAANAGEIGRAHETFLRGVLSRFLPEDLRPGTGFVASPDWTSRQQDILIYKRDFTRLFEVGECVVIDHNAFVGAVEVKTELGSSERFGEAIEFVSELKHKMGHQGLHALYAWEGLSLDGALEAIWAFVREAPTTRFDLAPDVVYVRGQYLLRANKDGHRDSPPFHGWHVGAAGITEGQALLGLVSAVWAFGLSLVLPWWLLSWHDHMGTVPGKAERISWPDDLSESVMADVERLPSL